MRKLVYAVFDKIKVWHFLLFFVLSIPISAYLLRQNNLKMLSLRDQVLQVDSETGDITKIAPYIKELGNYVLNHMNTNFGRIELPGTFNKEVDKIRKAAEISGAVDAKIYKRAQIKCEDPYIPLTARAQCIQDYVVSNAKQGTNISDLVFPDKSLFSYSFVSPTWSPDFAGFSVVLSIVSAMTVIFIGFTRVLLPVISKVIDKDPLE